MYVYVPAVLNVRPIDTFAFVPWISAGTPGAASKKTLCPTDPNANVTVCPTWVVRVGGVNASDAVASISSMAAGVVVTGDVGEVGDDGEDP